MNTFAASAAVVCGKNVKFGTKKTISVPVNIKNNSGIMGFKISVEFSNSILILDSVDQKTVTNSSTQKSIYIIAGDLHLFFYFAINRTFDFSKGGCGYAKRYP